MSMIAWVSALLPHLMLGSAKASLSDSSATAAGEETVWLADPLCVRFESSSLFDDL